MYERNNDNPKEYDRGRNKQIGEVCREAKRAAAVEKSAFD